MDVVVAAHNPEHLLATAAVLFVVLLAIHVMLGGLGLVGGGAVPLPGPGSLVRLRLLRRALVVVLLLSAWLVLSDSFDRGRQLPVFVVYHERTPAIADHVRDAQQAGKPSVLTRASSIQARRNRRASGCGRWRGPNSCDEYPFAASQQGGRAASVRGVPLRENLRQGGDLIAFFNKHRIPVGGAFKVVVQ
jgi:hypothetical protein